MEREPSPGKPCRGCSTLTLCEIIPNGAPTSMKVALCPECVEIYKNQPEKRLLLLTPVQANSGDEPAC